MAVKRIKSISMDARRHECHQGHANQGFCMDDMNQTNMEWKDLQTIFGKEEVILEYEAMKLIN